MRHDHTLLFGLLTLLMSPLFLVGCPPQHDDDAGDDDMADDDGVAVIAWEDLAPGEVVVIADSSMFGYYLDEADNTLFVRNLAAH